MVSAMRGLSAAAVIPGGIGSRIRTFVEASRGVGKRRCCHEGTVPVIFALHPSAGWLFIAGVRVSTMVTWTAFVFVGVAQHNLKRALLAAAMWLCGWEVAWQFARWLKVAHHHASWSLAIFAALAGFVVLLQRRAIRPSLPLIGVALLFSVIWIVTGFHINQHTVTHFDPLAEGLNEAAKTAWAIAYLWPLWLCGRSDERRVEARRAASADAAA